MNRKLIKIALRNISRNKRRSILSGSAIAVAAMSIVALFSLIEGMSADMAFNLKTYYTGEVLIKHADYEKYERYNPMHLTVDWNSIDITLAKEESVDTYVPRITFPSNLYISGSNFGAIGVGADFAKEADFQDLKGSLKAGRLPETGQNEMMMGGVLARDLKLKIGDKVTVMSTTAARGTNAITLEIVGLFAFPVGALNSKYFWVPLDRAQYFLRMDDGVQEVLIKLNDGFTSREAAPVIKTAVESQAEIEMDIRPWEELSTTYGMLKMAQMIYNFIAMFFFLLGSTVIINTTMMVIFERMREIGTLGALGMHGKELVRMFFLEGTFISMIGSAVGVAIGVLLTLWLGKVGIDYTDAMSGMDFEMSSIVFPQLSIGKTVFVYFYSVAIASAATFIPSRHAAKIEPVEALRYV
ncbi:MAG: ABC transporter permease [Spirochaetaceae bacterium]|jgi:putative ABC transport system permease protein|nr:ABC transporter permease [Spirochaetaceae bacterium]